MTQTQALTRTRWTLDAAHTHVGFAVRHMMFATVKGQFAALTGELQLDEQDTLTSVAVEIDTASVDTGTAQRDEHLRSVDFFDVTNYPQMKFVSRRVESLGGGEYRITGDLTIRGVTRQVALEAEERGRGIDPWGQEKIGFSATAKIRRGDYGLTWNQALEAGGVLVSDEVTISIEGQATLA